MATEILFAWIGNSDKNAPDADADSPGPIVHTVEAYQFSEIHLISCWHGEGIRQVERYVDWLRNRVGLPVALVQSEEVRDPNDFDRIYQVSSRVVADRVSGTSNYRLSFTLSAGTPIMACCWMLLACSRFRDARLIQSSEKVDGLRRVRTVQVPFDVSVIYQAQTQDRGMIEAIERSPTIDPAFSIMNYRSSSMFDAIAKSQSIASSTLPILILGESGTGKELLARAVHQASPRRQKPFVTVNCAAIAENLIDNELFGHKKGAFTDASTDSEGMFEKANGGTLFLDEIGELRLHLQAKLLRAVQFGEIQRVGESGTIDVDVRCILATHVDLTAAVVEGKFREDLYYRIAVFPIELPPLRMRHEDFNTIVDEILESHNALIAEQKKKPKRLSRDARRSLASHNWPGNVRELENVIARLVWWTPRVEITQMDVESALISTSTNSRGLLLEPRLGDGFNIDTAIEQFKRHQLGRALREAGGVKMKAAELLGIDTQRFRDWSRKLLGN